MSDTPIRIVEVGPRDGLQNEKQPILLRHKIELIEKLFTTGLTHIEAGAFVSPKWIPQMADTKEVLEHFDISLKSRLSVLVPNVEGFEQARAQNLKEIAVFTAVSETFSKKNTNCTIEESLQRITEVMNVAKAQKIRVRAYISCVWGCPYEGRINFDVTYKMIEKLLNLGVDEISLGDTIGVATAEQVNIFFKELPSNPVEKFAVHFHDTYGQALANTYAALQQGITIVDASVGGLGGCPYAPGATGNVATEDVVYLLHGMGLKTGINFEKLCRVGEWINKILGQPNRAKSGKAFLAKQ